MPHAYGIKDSAGTSAKASKVAAVAAQHAADVDARGRFPQETVAALGSSGLLGLLVPKDQGGGGEGPRAFCAVVEELAKACPSSAMIYVMHVSAAQAIAASKT